MLRALRTAALGMSAQQAAVDNTANNLANVNTTGFKRQTLVFQDLLYQTMRTGGQGDGTAGQLQVGNGSAVAASSRAFAQGSFTQTGNPLDVAISGDGFFQVRRPDGSVAYSRDGTLTMDADGQVVTQSGLPLEPPLELPPEAVDIQVTPDGVVRARVQGEAEAVEVGQLELARFSNPAGLRATGDNLYEQTDASGEPTIAPPGQDGVGTVRQGFLEASNVDVVQEMVSLITSQRAYEMNSKMVTTSEEMLQIANSMKR